MTDTIDILVVDDQALIAASFTTLLNATPGLHVAATAANGREALELLGAHDVGLVLMDIRMPIMNGITAIRRMRDDPDLRHIPVLVLTTFSDEDLVLGALRAGANGFLLKDADPATLIRAARVVADGGSWLDPAITGSVLAALEPSESPSTPAPTQHPDAVHEPLTPRESDVLGAVCEGLTNVAIGDRLHMAESTVKTHVRALLDKTGCANRVELIVHAFRTGLVAASPPQGGGTASQV